MEDKNVKKEKVQCRKENKDFMRHFKNKIAVTKLLVDIISMHQYFTDEKRSYLMQ